MGATRTAPARRSRRAGRRARRWAAGAAVLAVALATAAGLTGVAGAAELAGAARPLFFVPNRGQTDARVAFLAHGAGFNLFLAQGELVVVAPRATPATLGGGAEVIRLRFPGARPSPAIEGLDELPARVSYFLGRDPARWRAGLPTFDRVRYRELYPGVDLVIHGAGGALEADFVLAPGADPRAIRLAVAGAAALAPNAAGDLMIAAGDLMIAAGSGSLRLARPVVYQESGGARRPVAGAFVALAGGEVGFTVGPRDEALPLVIDPVLSYASYLGGSAEDVGQGIAVDSTGAAYVCGYTLSADFPAEGGLPGGLSGTSDAFVVKLKQDGSGIAWASYLGGSGGDSASAIAVDAAGAAYLTGVTLAGDFPTVGPFQPAFAGGIGDAFVAKLAPDGASLLYSSFLGGSGFEVGTAIAISGGAAYVTGETDSTDFPAVGAVQPSPGGGGGDAFAAKVAAGGATLAYSTYLAGGAEDRGEGIAVDAAGSAYVTGWTLSGNFPTTAGAWDRICQSCLQATPQSDGFVVKLSPTGAARTYATFLGGGHIDRGRAIAVDAAGAAYVAGGTDSTDYPTTPGAYDTSCNSCVAFPSSLADAVVTKLNAAGSGLVYSTFLSGTNFANASGIAIDATGAAYVAGYTCSLDFPTLYPVQPTLRGCYDAFVTKLKPAGAALAYSTYLGGTQVEFAPAIALDALHSAYVTGSTTSTVGFPLAGPFQPVYGGGAKDGFVAKIATDLLRDDFEDGVLASGWSYDRGSWSESGGRLHAVPDGALPKLKAKAVALPLFPGAGCGVCTVEATLTVTNVLTTASGSFVRLYGWYRGGPENVSVSLNPVAGNLVFRQRQGAVKLTQITVPTTIGVGVPHHVKISFDGTTFTVWLDGTQVLTAPNAATGTPTGSVGFQSRNAEIDADDLAVTTPGAE